MKKHRRLNQKVEKLCGKHRGETSDLDDLRGRKIIDDEEKWRKNHDFFYQLGEKNTFLVEINP